MTEVFKAEGDDYSYIMAEALADRLAEAAAERLHELVRREVWGYAADEALSVDDMLKVKYRGIRPAAGYPSQPDHTEKRTMWELMRVEQQVGVDVSVGVGGCLGGIGTSAGGWRLPASCDPLSGPFDCGRDRGPRDAPAAEAWRAACLGPRAPCLRAAPHMRLATITHTHTHTLTHTPGPALPAGGQLPD